MGDTPVELAVTTLRSQRHSFMNHLQVMLGWLQLGRPERARQYLEGLASRMAGESEAIRQVPPSTALAILTLGLEAETYGAHLEWRVRGPVVPSEEADLELLRVRVREAIRALLNLPETERQIQIDLGERVDLHMPRPVGER